MAKLVRSKPTSPGVRGRVRVSEPLLHRGGPLRALSERIASRGGRNNLGRLTARRKGRALSRRIYRRVSMEGVREPHTVVRLERDPHRSAWIALVRGQEGRLSYVTATEGLLPGSEVTNAPNTAHSRVELGSVKLGETVCLVSKDQWGKAAYARAAGSSMRVLGRDERGVILEMTSGEARVFDPRCWATIGQVSNQMHLHERHGKAGVAVGLGRKMIVRGMAQNPVDHPMGSKGGRKKGGIPKTKWGKVAKGPRTRDPKRASSRLILRRRYES